MTAKVDTQDKETSEPTDGHRSLRPADSSPSPPWCEPMSWAFTTR